MKLLSFIKNFEGRERGRHIKTIIKRFQELFKYAGNIGFFHLVTANLLIQVAGFGMQIVLARLMSQEDISRITVLQSFYNSFILIAQLGISAAIIKLCSENISEEAKEELMITGIKINVVTSLSVVAIVIISSYFNVFSTSDMAINQGMRIYILHLPLVVLNYISIAYLQSQSKIKTMSRYQILTRLIIIISLMGFSFIWGFKGYLYGIIFSNFVAFLILYRVSVIKTARFSIYPIKRVIVKKLFDYSKYALVANLIYQWVLNIGVIMANYYLVDNREDIAKYGMAVLLINGIIMIPSSFNQIMVPRISNISHDLRKVKAVFHDFRKKMLLLIILLLIGSNIVVPYIVPLLLGEKYMDSILYFRILSVGLLSWGVYSPIGNTFMSIGKLRYNVASNGVVLVTQVALNVILIPLYGVMGLAFAFVISNAVGAIINQLLITKVFNRIQEE